MLVDRGTSVNRAVDGGEAAGATALHYACAFGHTEIPMTLLCRGADLTMKTAQGGTPLDYARDQGHTELVSLLTNWAAAHPAAPPPPLDAAAVQAMRPKQLKEELKARGVSTAGMLEASELRAALLAAAAPPPPLAEEGESSGAPPEEEEEEDEDAALVAANENKPQSLLPARLRRCEACGLTAQQAGVERLSSCGGTCRRSQKLAPFYYCGEACQAVAWGEHRLVCAAPDWSGAPEGWVPLRLR
jgi:hypothetical protein